MITTEQVPTPRTFTAADNTLADVPGIPQIPVFPVQTQNPLHKSLMDAMTQPTREAFVEYHYFSGDPVDIDAGAGAFHYLMAADLFDLSRQAIKDNNPRDVSLHMTLAYTFLNAARQNEQNAVVVHSGEDLLAQPRETAEAAREHAAGHFGEYSETMLEAWRTAGQPDQYANPDTGVTEPAGTSFVP